MKKYQGNPKFSELHRNEFEKIVEALKVSAGIS